MHHELLASNFGRAINIERARYCLPPRMDDPAPIAMLQKAVGRMVPALMGASPPLPSQESTASYHNEVVYVSKKSGGEMC